MMKKQLIYVLTATLFFQLACNPDDVQNDLVEEEILLSKEEAEELIHTSTDEFKDDVVGMLQSEGMEATMDAAVNLISLLVDDSEFRANKKPKMRDKGNMLKNSLKKIAQFSVPSKENFRSSTAKVNDGMIYGVYAWNFETEEFDLIEDSEDYLEVRFPTQNATENNAVLIVDNLSFDEYYPLSLSVELSVNATLMMSIDYNGQFENDWPTQLSFSAYLNPISYQVNFDAGQSSVASYYTSVMIGEKIITATDVEMGYVGHLFEDADVQEVSGYYQLIDLIFDGSVDVGGMLALDETEQETADPNDFTDISLYIDEQFIGEIVLVKEEEVTDFDTYEYWAPYVQLENEELIDLASIIEGVVEDIEKELDKMAERWSI